MHHHRRGVAKLDVIPTAAISATPSVFVSQELVESANAGEVRVSASVGKVPLQAHDIDSPWTPSCFAILILSLTPLHIGTLAHWHSEWRI